MAKTTTRKTKTVAIPVIEVVPQDTIAALYTKRAEAAELSKRLAALNKDLDAQEVQLLAKLKGGAQVEGGVFVAGIEVAPGRCAPKWKDEAILLAAANGLTPSQYEESVKAKYPPKMNENLQITKLG